MRYILCALVIMLAGLPAPLWAAEAPTDAQLRKRLQDLDRRIDRLERRERSETAVERKERQADRKAGAKTGTAATAAAKEPTKAQWAKVKIGMQADQVKAILGEPLRTRTTREHQIWSWHPASVSGGEVWFRDTDAERVYAPR